MVRAYCGYGLLGVEVLVCWSFVGVLLVGVGVGVGFVVGERESVVWWRMGWRWGGEGKAERVVLGLDGGGWCGREGVVWRLGGRCWYWMVRGGW